MDCSQEGLLCPTPSGQGRKDDSPPPFISIGRDLRPLGAQKMIFACLGKNALKDIVPGSKTVSFEPMLSALLCAVDNTILSATLEPHL